MTPQILAIMPVRNEDKFLRRAALNTVGFCDRILVADHQSQDGQCAVIAFAGGNRAL
jgi:ATP adenylyltransferase/5',5'''-P-1,P-4-tetraphosphate phosphorylase II